MSTSLARSLRWAIPLLALGLAACLEYPDPAYGGDGAPPPTTGAAGVGASTTEPTASGPQAAPTYYGYRLHYDRWGRPMYYYGGSWRYVPPTAPGYAWYRRYWLQRQRARSAPSEGAPPPATAPPARSGAPQTYSDFDPDPAPRPRAPATGTVPPPAPGEPARP